MTVGKVHISSSFPLITNFFKSDDIGGMIDEAKNKAATANDTASNTMDKLNAIRKEIDKISVTPVDSNLSSVLDDVDQSGEILKRCIKAHQAVLVLLYLYWYSMVQNNHFLYFGR